MPEPKPQPQSTATPLLTEGGSQQPSNGPGGYGTSNSTSSSNSTTTATPSTSKDAPTTKTTSKPFKTSSKSRWSRYAKYVYAEEGAEENPEAHASIWSLMFISWMTPIFQRGYDHTLQEEDLFAIVPERKTELQGFRLERLWKKEQDRVIQYLKDNQSDETPKPSAWYGYGLTISYLIVCLVQTALTQLWLRSIVITGSLCRSALTDLVFQKSTRISSKDRLDYPDGTIFNIMSNDATRLDSCLEGLGFLYTVPMTVVVTVGLLMYWMGPSVLVGAAVLIFSNPLQTWAMTLLNPIRNQVAKLTDSRMGLVTEILQGIKVIKFFAYEPSFWKKLTEIRLSELKCTSWLLQVRGLIYSTSSSLPVFASALTFVLYAALGNKLEPEIIFPSLAFFTGLRVPLLILPYCYSDTMDAYVSVKRIQKFLLTEDTLPLPPVDKSHDSALSIKDADFYWDQLPSTTVAATLLAEEKQGTTTEVPESTAPNSSRNSITEDSEFDERQPLLSASNNTAQGSVPKIKPFLRDISLRVPRGSLVAIVGPVGSGKSSLLQAIVGNMRKSQGEVIRGATISYASQTPWIQNATIMDNILFDTPMEEERYWRVIKACSLEQDLTQFTAGDKTEIGERGVNMSGGQKARLSLARSVYYNAEMVIMDDPLSAVDAHVGKRLWEDCVLHELSNKTRVIATHQLHVLPDVDYVVCMKHGRIAEQGTFRELMSHQGDFFKLMKQYGGHHHHHDDGDESGTHQPCRRVLKRNKSSTGKVVVTTAAGAVTESDDDLTVLQESDEIVLEDDESTKEIPKGQMTDEERASGAVSKKVYREYFRLGGDWNWVFIVFLLSAQQAAGVAFSKDVSTVDNMAAINSLLITVTGILSVLILSAVFLPWIIPVMVPLAIMYYYVALYYQKTSRELKRMDALVRSHLFSYFSETLNGMGTLKAYQPHGIECAIERNRINMDRSHRIYYIYILGTRWIGARVFVVGHVLNFVALVLIVWARDDIDPATAGLILSYLARLASEMSWAIQCAADLENNMTSAERLFYYTDSLEQEPPAEILDRKPVPSWPQQGRISFQEVSLRYRPELPLVLNKISFDIQAGHKVGVVGRTGAGKSSLIQALFLLVPLDPGSKIVMDGIETDTIGIADLRSRMSIIPQDPVLFQGTFRYNLDPLNKHTEQELWKALEASDLKGYVQQQEGGLDAVVAAQGENLSVGQRQLVCLSRALLSRSKVVILDEATASVDLATDSLIQKAIRVDFSDSTVITIAHRLNTVVDYNRILVMDRGQVAEYDTPRDLLKDRQSLFSKMVDETGEANAALLRSLAGC
ncbi:hypothetical protein BG015_007537 [Linnemannia schmuckeri]|uniref:P-loop containing nucleoside triphosphate hydrolase protein n=1 Tax=Linnemannia schmuckeri TaxID=64567 RepID=A0A9P5S0V4_9FUNG|nr:hypothetical protein BG015_007537 [Linnemannia schmuckeri]